MKNIELTVNVDGKEVKAITIYAKPKEFAIKLKDGDFKGCLGPRLLQVSNGIKNYVDKNNTFSNYGLEFAKFYTELLYKANEHTSNYTSQIKMIVDDAVETLSRYFNSDYKKLKKVKDVKKILKQYNKDKIIDDLMYEEIIYLIKNHINFMIESIDKCEFDIINNRAKNYEGLLIENDENSTTLNIAIIEHIKALLDEELVKLSMKEL